MTGTAYPQPNVATAGLYPPYSYFQQNPITAQSNDTITLASSTITPNGAVAVANQIYEYLFQVPVRQVWRLGFGMLTSGNADTRGIINLEIKDNSGTPVDLPDDADIQIGYLNAGRKLFVPIWSGKYFQVHEASPNTRNNRNSQALDVNGLVKENSYISVRVSMGNVGSFAAFSDANSKMYLPIYRIEY